MIDLALLRIIKYRERYDKVAKYIPISDIDKKTKAIVNDLGKYFKAHPDATVIDFPTFRSLFFTSWHKNIKGDAATFYNKLLEQMETDVNEYQDKNIINQLLELEFATSVGNLVEQYQQGEELDIVNEIGELHQKVAESLDRITSFEFAGFEDNLVGEEGEDKGLKWPLNVMNKHYRSIQPADQYIVAARPGKGKTTFLTQLNHSLAQQMPANKCIVWFNNESRRQRIMTRQIQSALFITNKEMAQLKEQKKLEEEYIKEMGSLNRVRVYDIHGKTHFQLEEILASVGRDNVGAIVVDMLDNVKFPTRKDVREDQRLEQMYQWLRERGVEYECPTFPTSQISNEGAGLMFPTENMLKDSKTGKQGACDGIIMLGSSDDPLLQKKRGISMPKTKSKLEGMTDMREEITFDADRGRYL